MNITFFPLRRNIIKITINEFKYKNPFQFNSLQFIDFIENKNKNIKNKSVTKLKRSIFQLIDAITCT